MNGSAKGSSALRRNRLAAGAPALSDGRVVHVHVHVHVHDLVALLLLAALAMATPPSGAGGLIFLAIVGFGLGYLLYAGRPGPVWARILLVAGIPALLVLLLALAFRGDDVWMIPFALPIAAGIGVRVARLRERATRPNRRVIVHDWAGIERVGGSGSASFRVRPLWRRVPRAETRAFRTAHPHLAERGHLVRVIFVSLVAAVMPIGLLAMGFGVVQEIEERSDDMVSQLLGMAAVISLMLLGAAILVWWSFRARQRVTRAEDHLRLAEFAAANGLSYEPGPVAGTGGTGRGGSPQILSRVMRGRGSRPITIANRENVRDAAGFGGTHFGGVCTLELRTELPNVLLRSKRQRFPAFSSYVAPDRSQVLSLEGDFDRHFELYCPPGYERDALYLFTPDVMAWLVDDVEGFDVELVDHRLVLRSRRDVVTVNPADWARLARALGAVGDRIVQWERWRDDRTGYGDAGSRLRLVDRSRFAHVGPGGRRLRLGIGAGLVLAVGFGAVYLALTVLATAL